MKRASIAILVAILVFVVLIISAGVMAGFLVAAREPTNEETKKIVATRSMIVATKDLQAFTLITGDVEGRAGTNQQVPPTDPVMNRFLLTSVKQGAEVKEENLAPAAATNVLKDSFVVSIPASPATSLGGQVRVGDIVGLLGVSKKENVPPADEKTPVASCEPLVVLNITPANKETNAPGSITLAVPTSQRAQLVAALSGTEYLLTRKIVVH